MGSAKIELETGIHAAFRAVPVHPLADDHPLRLCVIARQRPDPVTGSFVLLRDLADASVFLGCIGDANGRCRSRWVRCWSAEGSGWWFLRRVIRSGTAPGRNWCHI